MATEYAFLIPGFLGFGQIGNLAYFNEDKALGLAVTLQRRGIEVYRLKTLPTASIELRAKAMGREILEYTAARPSAARIHLIGHSTGGLDACELVSRLSEHCPSLQGRIVSITTLATPHYGTPLADFFAWLGAEFLLELAGRIGSTIPWSLFSGLTDLPGLRGVRDAALAILKEVAGVTSALLEAVVDLVTAPWTARGSAALHEYFERMARNQGALHQLTQSRKPYQLPAGIRCFSYVTGAPPAGDGMPLSRTLYRLLYQVTGQVDATHYPPLPATLGIADAVPELNDGVVPTRSMVWGRCLGYLPGDHMDIIGHPALLEPGHHPNDAMIRRAHEAIAEAIISG